MAAATIRNFAKHATASRETMSARFLLRGLCIGTIRVSIRFIVKRIDYLGAIKGTIWLSIAPPPPQGVARDRVSEWCLGGH